MNGKMRVAFTVALILGIATIGFANATPRLLKQCNMLYSTSENPDKWLPVAGNQVSDFKLKLDASVEWYYLDIKFIKPTLPAGYYMFWLTPPPTTDTAFWNYWAAKGVTASATMGTWQYVMWRIIKPAGTPGTSLPMFALYSDGEGGSTLCDGLLRFFANARRAPLRVNGDYPKGTYTFTCRAAVTATEPFVSIDNILENTVMTIEFR
jgi:hypothetical protein